MSRVVVTGGAGYIGSHAVRALVDAGHAVAVLDDLSAGHAEALPKGVPLVRAAIHDRAAVHKLLVDHRADAVMHFAARLKVGESVQQPIEYYKNNVTGTLSVLEAMRDAGVKRFVFSSTCAVYGEPIETPIRETHPTAPINAYGQTKLAIEHALPHYERAWGLQSIRLRYFNAAGADPGGELGEDHYPEIHAIPRAIEAATGGPEFKIMGTDYPTPDGTCLRDYIHVTDLADAHVRALRRLEAGGPSQSYNLGTERPTSVREIVAAVERVSGRRVASSVAPRRPGDPAVLYASAQRAREELGWVPARPAIDAIVADAWRWHQRGRQAATPGAH